MTEQEILKKAASLKGKLSWQSRVKKAGGIKAAKANMRALRRRRNTAG